MELWLEESRKRDEERQKEEVHREEERSRAVAPEGGGMETDKRRESLKVREIMRTLAGSLAEHEL